MFEKIDKNRNREYTITNLNGVIMMVKTIRENLMKYFKDFNLDEVLYHDAIKYAIEKGNESYIDIIFDAKKQIESNLVKKAENDIDVEILLLDRYRSAMAVLVNIYELNMDVGKKIYELSVEDVLKNYDNEKLLIQNISKVMVNKAKEMGYFSARVQRKMEKEMQEETIIEENLSDNEIEEGPKVEEQINYEENIDILDYIDKNYLFDILKDELSNYEYSVAKLLFGANGKIYSVESVSKVLEVDIKKITEIYVKCLGIVRDKFSNWYDGQMKLEYTNAE